jgi:hypothetical protein
VGSGVRAGSTGGHAVFCLYGQQIIHHALNDHEKTMICTF